MSNAAPSPKSGPHLSIGIAAVGLVGGLLLLFGWSRRQTRIGRLASTGGVALLTRALKDPAVTAFLGNFGGLLGGPLAIAQKMLQ